MNKTLVLYGTFIFDYDSVTVQNIDSVELLNMDLEDAETLADNKCGYTGLDYFIPQAFNGSILWQSKVKA
jgi:hypothetical protein